MNKILTKLSLIVMIFFVLCQCGGNKDKSGSSDKGQAEKMSDSGLKLGLEGLPEWSKGVVKLDIQTAMKTPIYGMIKSSNEFKKFEKQLADSGMDIEKDIKSIVAGMSEPKVGSPKPDVVFFIEANYDEAKVIEKLKKEQKDQFITDKFEDYTTITKKDSDSDPIFAFIEGKYILGVFPKTRLKEAVDTMKGNGKTLADNKKLFPIVQKAQENNLFWYVQEVTDTIKEQTDKGLEKTPLGGPLGKQLTEVTKKLDAFVISSKFEDKMTLSIGGTGDDSSAKELKKVLDDILAQFKPIIATQLPPEVIKELKVIQENNSASLMISLTPDQINKLTQKIAK